MQCVSCQFFNVPGSAACGRCGTTLRFDQLDIATTPPRAPKHGRWLRNAGLTWLNRGREAVRSGREVTTGEARPFFGDDVPPLSEWLRMLVPGWPLRRVGAVTAGWAVLAGWLLLAALAVLYVGTQLGGLVVGLAFSLHYSAGLSSFRLAGLQRLHLFRAGSLLALLLIVVIYIPVPLLFNQAVQPITVRQDFAPFKEGDVLLYSPAFAPRPGEVRPGQWIVFELTWEDTNRLRSGYQFNVIMQPGLYMSRVLGRPGDLVRWDGETLTVNGEPSVWQPAAGPKKAQSTTVPDGQYFIAPWTQYQYENNPYQRGERPGLNLESPLRHVAADRVRGRVFYKLHPLAESSRVR